MKQQNNYSKNGPKMKTVFYLNTLFYKLFDLYLTIFFVNLQK